MSNFNQEVERLQKVIEEERREKLEERRQKEEEQRKNRKTTLDEYLHNCHIHVYKRLALADISKSTTGYATRVDGKYYPKWLRPWDRFTNHHRQQHFQDIENVCGEKRCFPQESTTIDNGGDVARITAGSEDAIVEFEKTAVVRPFIHILECILKEESRREEYQCMGLRLDKNSLSLIQSSDLGQVGDVVQSHDGEERTATGERIASGSAIKRPTIKPDGYGIRTHLDGVESFAFVYDYKPAHKFTAGYMRAAVAKETLFMEVIELVNKNKSTTDETLKIQEHEETRIAMALTQVFHYMVRCGVAYGYVAAGKCLVFLHVDRADLQTLYYHLCIPDEELAETSAEGQASQVSLTAVAQLASFALLSLRSEALQGEALDAALLEAEKELETWGTPYDDAAHLLGGGTGSGHSSQTASPSLSEGSLYVPEESPATSKQKHPLRLASPCRVAAVLRGEDDGGDGGGAGRDRSPIRTRSRRQARNEGAPSGGYKSEDAGTSDSAPGRQYCTQACLLGLKRGLDLDEQCPNVLAHRAAKGDDRHPINAAEFTRLVGERLRQNPYRRCEALDRQGKVGAIGVLFKLELPPYGYTFVGKGTFSGLRGFLEHEGDIYAHLDALQGEAVPVYLGLVHLRRGYVFPGRDRVFHMMLMSWGGEEVPDARTPAMDAEVQRSSRAVRAAGVYHGDERRPNRLWNEERRRVMLIDFDRATVLPAPKHKRLAEVSKQRKRPRTLARCLR